jgi:hypothetical protein
MMVKLVETNKEFKNLYGKILSDYEAEMQLFSQNLIVDYKIDKVHIRGAVYNQRGDLALLFLNANPFKLLLFGINNSLETSKELADYIKSEEVEIKGILGSENDTALFIQGYGDNFLPGMRMDIMKLNQLNNLKIRGKLNKPTESDLDFIKSGFREFQEEVIGRFSDEEFINKKALEYLESPGFFLYQNEDGVKTSFAHLKKRTEKGLTVSLVYTFKEYRCRGYAKEMINLLCAYGLRNAEYITLFVDQTNPISNKVYLDNGFQIIRENIEYHFVKKESYGLN